MNAVSIWDKDSKLTVIVLGVKTREGGGGGGGGGEWENFIILYYYSAFFCLTSIVMYHNTCVCKYK